MVLLVMKVNNMHEFVKKTNNAAFAGSAFCDLSFDVKTVSC